MQDNKVKKKRTFFSDIKNLRKNWSIVKSSPYGTLKFRYQVQRILIIALSLFFIYSFYRIILTFRGGSSIMTLVGRALMLLILVLLISKAWQTLSPLKRTLKQYEKNPQHKNYKQLNVEQEIDDILESFESKSQKVKKDINFKKSDERR